ncbi:MAG TPA: protein kinase [Bacteroidota bacterium]|nr:protein kinase [Bacteroidota bacterium]
MIGQTISHYKILEKLGEGGMGVVYKARDTELDRFVALKFLPPYLASDSVEKERFYHEARAASALNHPNIATIHEIKEFENRLYLAMEFIDGKTLKATAAHENLSIQKILDIAIQVCDGLAAAHEKGVVHRDIKSDNIMLTPRGQVKITDFGLAKVKGATKLTKAGSTIGTAAYMSPEQAQGVEVDHRTDIFSFGVVLYELITRRLPFQAEHQAALIYSLINEDPQPLARFNDKASPELERIVLKALAKDRDERYQHVDDLLADLRHERKGLEYAKAGYARSTATGMLSAQPAKGKRLLKIAVPAGAFAILIALAIVFNPFNFQIITQKTHAASENNSLAVMYFENIPDPEDKDHTGEMLSNLLITALFQTKNLEVISRERLYDIRKELGEGDSKSIPPSLATKIAQRAGVSMMLLGSILQKEPSLAVTFRLIEVQSGKILSTQRLAGFSKEKIFSLADTLALLVKDDLNLTSATDARSVAEVTTRSAEAYRSYLEGIDLEAKFSFEDSKGALRRAIELDSNFAMAHNALARVEFRTGENTEGTAALRRAYVLRKNVSERERLLIEAAYAQIIEKDPLSDVRILEQLIEKYPGEQIAYRTLALEYFRKFYDPERAIEKLASGLKHDPMDKSLWNILAYGYASVGKRAEAFEALDHYLNLAPGEPNPYDTKGDLYFMFGERDSAVIWYRKAVAIRSDFGSNGPLAADAMGREDYERAREYLLRLRSPVDFSPIISAHQGKLNQTQKELLANLSAHQRQHLQDLMAGDYLLLILTAYELGDYPAMVKYAKARCERLRNDPGNKVYGRDALAWAYLKAGNIEMYKKVVEELKEASNEQIAIIQIGKLVTSGLFSFEQGDYAASAGKYREASQIIRVKAQPQLPFAVSLLKAGQTEEAVREFRRVADWYPTGYTEPLGGVLPTDAYWAIASVKAHYWLGVAYEGAGRKDDAIKEYERFLKIWKDADFKSKELEDARAHLARLVSR